jgi:hypothetical protein
VLLGVSDEAKNRQMEHIMGRVTELVSSVPAEKLDPELEKHLGVILNGWLALTFEICRQRIIDPTTDAERLAEACAHALLDAIARVPGIPDELAHLMTTSRF